MNDTLLVNRVLNTFRNMRCRMSMYCLDEDIRFTIVKTLIERMVEKNNAVKILVAVDDFNDRASLKKIINPDLFANNIVCLTTGFINPYYNYKYNCLIYIGSFIEEKIFLKLIEQNKFGLILLTENIMDSNFINYIRRTCPDAGFAIQDYRSDVTRPVEGELCPVDLSNDDRELYKQYTRYTNDTISVFGSIEMVNMARSGNSKTNTSATEIRDTIARNNGWSETLDTSQDYNRQLDDIYNPNALYERACNFFNIADKRRKLVIQNELKLEKILEIVKENDTAKILIVNKNDQFANAVSEYLRQEGYQCGDYHDDIPEQIDVDDNGIPRYIKSGKNAGKVRIIKSRAISSRDEQRFNNSITRLLSIKSASNVGLSVHCDVVIFTSTLCDDIESFKTRFRNVKINGIPNKVYYIYSSDTIEENNIKNLQTIPFLTLHNEQEKNAVFDENSNQIIL